MSFGPPPIRSELTDEWLDGLLGRIKTNESKFRTVGMLISDTEKEVDFFLNANIDTIFARHCSGLKQFYCDRVYHQDEFGRIGARISDFRVGSFASDEWDSVSEGEKLKSGLSISLIRLLQQRNKESKRLIEPEKFGEDSITLALETGGDNRIMLFRNNSNGVIGNTQGIVNFNF